jgi:hypothetical protein
MEHNMEHKPVDAVLHMYVLIFCIDGKYRVYRVGCTGTYLPLAPGTYNNSILYYGPRAAARKFVTFASHSLANLMTFRISLPCLQ